MNQYAASNFITCLTTIFLAVFVFFYNKKSRLNKIFCLYSLSISVWSFFTALHAYTDSQSISLLSAKILHLAVPFIPILFFHFCVEILEFYDRQKYKIFAGYLMSVIFVFINLTSRLIVLEVKEKLGYHYFTEGGLLYPWLILYFSVYVALGLYFLLKGCYATKGNKRNQIRYLFGGSLLGYIFGSSCFFPVYNITIFPYPFGSYAISLYVFITAYAIIRYRLMDIRMALTRASIFVVVYTVVLGLPFALAFWFKPWLSAALGLNWWIAPLGVMALLATVGPFVYIYLDKQAEERLLKEQKRYQDTLKQASLGMTRIRDLQKLLNLIVHIVSRAVRLNYAGIYLMDRDNSLLKLKAVRKERGIQIASSLAINTILVKWLLDKNEPLILDELKQQIPESHTREWNELKSQMDSLGAAIVIPCMIENKLLGFMALGQKRSGKIYTESDLQVFTVLVNQAALAIENARFFEEAKEMQEQIAQAEKMATVGTMADGLSHQINNRFHALSLIAGDTLDSIKLAGIENYTGAPKELFGEIKYAMTRIQDNVMQGGQVVSGMLRYTRKTDTGFAAVSLDAIIDSALEMLNYKIKLNAMEIIRDYSKDTPRIEGNLPQLQEVFFNLIDNAYDAMMERRNNLKEESYQPRLRICAPEPGGEYLKIVIEDNGMGIRPDDLKKMFTPFFTTKVSSRRGTGLGLYVIKKIITQNHKGRIEVESNYGQGTRFILELPAALQETLIGIKGD